MVNTKKLRAKMVERGVSPVQMSEALGFDRSTFYRRLQNNGSRITIGEMHKMADVLGLGDAEAAQIFLARNSH